MADASVPPNNRSDPLLSSDMLTYYRGRVALHAVLEALGIGPGCEVVLQAFTCLAVPLPIVALGAKPVYVDADARDFGPDVGDLEAKLTPRTRAIIIQHTFGIPADIVSVWDLASRRGIPLIEDCCHAAGATVHGRPVGTFGVAAFYSFEWGKPVVAGVGGGLVANDAALRGRIRDARVRLRRPPLRTRLAIEAQYLAHSTVLSGRTYWLLKGLYHRLSAAGLLVGTFAGGKTDGSTGAEFEWTMAPRVERRLSRALAQLHELISHHKRIARDYEEGLATLALHPYRPPPGRSPVYLFLPLRTHSKAEVLERARRARVPLADIFRTPVHPVPSRQAEQVGYVGGACPVAEELCSTVVSLPVNTRISRNSAARTLDFVESSRSLFT